jgi:hypothetical protein
VPTATHTNTQSDPENQPDSSERCDRAAPGFPNIDVTIEDDTEIQPGDKFTKTWRVTNTGTCTWDTSYQVVWFSGETLGVLQNYNLAEIVPPGESIDISIDLEAPLEPGTYQGNWKLKNTSGELFGIGPEGENSFWVRIIVPEIATETPTPTPTATATTGPQASGEVDLEVDDSVDLDTLQLNSADADLAYNWVQAGDEDIKHQLVPLGNAQIAFFGDSRPSMEACQSAALSAAPVIVENLVPIAYLCYRTNQGLPGWLRFDGRDPSTNTISIKILTWSLP